MFRCTLASRSMLLRWVLARVIGTLVCVMDALVPLSFLK